MSTLPQKPIVLVCDDIRQELGAKVTLLGVLGVDVTIPEEEAAPGTVAALPSLGIFISFHDGEGTFKASFRLRAPDGSDLIPESHPTDAVKKSEGAMNFILRFSPFPIRYGTYTLTITLDSKKYETTFVFRKGPKAAPTSH